MVEVREKIANANYDMGLEAFSLWLQVVTAVQEDVLMTSNPNADIEMDEDKPKYSTFSTFTDNNTHKNTV